jgi:hypothetical protein
MEALDKFTQVQQSPQLLLAVQVLADWFPQPWDNEEFLLASHNPSLPLLVELPLQLFLGHAPRCL